MVVDPVARGSGVVVENSHMHRPGDQVRGKEVCMDGLEVCTARGPASRGGT